MTRTLHLSIIAVASFALGAAVLLFTGCEGAKYAGSTTTSRPMSTALARDEAGGGGGLAASGTPVDELWVIARPEGVESSRLVESSHVAGAMQRGSDDQTPGTGAMLTTLPGQTQPVPMPLKHTSVKAQISAYLATVDVTQQFHNPFDQKIEAVYVFPLPQNAAVNEFIMTIGDRRIRGLIRQREEAERIYEEARAQGHVASLLTQERPNIFTQKVANIEPGRQIDVNIRYLNTLAFDDGWYEFVFPMVVGPRFNPPAFSEGIGAVARGRRGASGQPTEVQYLRPTERSGHDIALTVDVDAGVTIEAMESVNHKVLIGKPFDSPSYGGPALHIDTVGDMKTRGVQVKLSPFDTLPNKDFVLRWKIAGERIKTNVLTYRDERGGFFTLVLYPPQDLRRLERSPMEMVFVLDCSGSMNGRPIDQAKDAITHGLRQLRPGDTFQVIRFSSNASQFGPEPVPARPRDVRDAVRYVKQLNGSGGTMMIEGIKAALDFPHDPERLRVVSFMTDGYIGNDRQILGQVKRRVGDSRIFSFGVGSSPNRYLMDRMARLGRGAVAYLSLNDQGDEVMDRFFGRISRPALTDITLDFGNARVSDVYPARIPDLFLGRPVVITGRFDGQLDDGVRVTGRAGGRTVNIVIPTEVAGATAKHPGIPSVWARARLAELYDQTTYSDDPMLARQIRDTALQFDLMSEFTAFIAVDSLTTTAGDHGVTVNQPVPVPDGVRYETTVIEQ